MIDNYTQIFGKDKIFFEESQKVTDTFKTCRESIDPQAKSPMIEDFIESHGGKNTDNDEKLNISSSALQEKGRTGKTRFSLSSNEWKDVFIR